MTQIPVNLLNALGNQGIVVNPGTGVLTVAQWQAFTDAVSHTSAVRDLKQFYQEAAASGILPAGVNS
jgi:hypothetical protein